MLFVWVSGVCLQHPSNSVSTFTVSYPGKEEEGARIGLGYCKRTQAFPPPPRQSHSTSWRKSLGCWQLPWYASVVQDGMCGVGKSLLPPHQPHSEVLQARVRCPRTSCSLARHPIFSCPLHISAAGRWKGSCVQNLGPRRGLSRAKIKLHSTKSGGKGKPRPESLLAGVGLRSLQGLFPCPGAPTQGSRRRAGACPEGGQKHPCGGPLLLPPLPGQQRRGC